jgi:hypothetical protein
MGGTGPESKQPALNCLGTARVTETSAVELVGPCHGWALTGPGPLGAGQAGVGAAMGREALGGCFLLLAERNNSPARLTNISGGGGYPGVTPVNNIQRSKTVYLN